MISIIVLSQLERSLRVGLYVLIMVFGRKYLNLKAGKYSSIFLWTIIIFFLLFPYGIAYKVEPSDYPNLLGTILQFLIDIKLKLNDIMDFINSYIHGINRSIVASFILIYISYQSYKSIKAMYNSKEIELDDRMLKIISDIGVERKVRIMINDNYHTPMTYGIIKPIIVLQSDILQDDIRLEYILTHELIHINRFDIVWNHLRQVLVCINWYNPFILLLSKYLEQDIEILCDKLVLNKLGISNTNKKRYSLVMYDIAKKNFKNNIFVLNMNPTIERVSIMKNYKLKKTGIMATLLLTIIMSTAFITVKDTSTGVVTEISGGGSTADTVINIDMRTKEISREEYANLKLKDINLMFQKSVNLNNKETLKKFSSKSYTFDLKSSSGLDHNEFVIDISNTYSKKGVNYALVIEEGDNILYSASKKSDVILSTSAKRNETYTVTIANNSPSTMTYNINIKSYRR